MLRFALALSAASELARARFTLLADPPHNYFFYLYLAYVITQVWTPYTVLSQYRHLDCRTRRLPSEGLQHRQQ